MEVGKSQPELSASTASGSNDDVVIPPPVLDDDQHRLGQDLSTSLLTQCAKRELSAILGLNAADCDKLKELIAELQWAIWYGQFSSTIVPGRLRFFLPRGNVAPSTHALQAFRAFVERDMGYEVWRLEDGHDRSTLSQTALWTPKVIRGPQCLLLGIQGPSLGAIQAHKDSSVSPQKAQPCRTTIDPMGEIRENLPTCAIL